MGTLEKIVDFGKVQKRTGQTVDLIGNDNINLSGLDVGKKAFEVRAGSYFLRKSRRHRNVFQ